MTIDPKKLEMLFSREKLSDLFPPQRADQFFEALLGDAGEGSYDIQLAYKGVADNQLMFNIELHQRPGKCLACHLTYGLPNVFSRHPVIDLKGVVEQIDRMMNGHARCAQWKLGATQELSPQMHVVPLIIDIQ